MRVLAFAVTIVIASFSPTFAAPSEQPLDAFLEQRGAEELAARGALLSRRDVDLHVETTVDELTVELRRPTTGDVVARTRIARIRGDREMAVAQVIAVATALLPQLPPPVPFVLVLAPPASVSAVIPRGTEERPRSHSAEQMLGGVVAMGVGAIVFTRGERGEREQALGAGLVFGGLLLAGIGLQGQF